MAVVETERHGQVLVVRMNRPERLNALNTEMRAELARIWTSRRRRHIWLALWQCAAGSPAGGSGRYGVCKRTCGSRQVALAARR